MINTGDTAFMLAATAMVMLMTPGPALFCGADGLFLGNPVLLGIQAMEAFSSIIYSIVVTFVILKLTDVAIFRPLEVFNLTVVKIEGGKNNPSRKLNL